MTNNTDPVISAKEHHGAAHGQAKPEHADFHSETPPESPTPRVLSREQPMPSISRLLKGKEHEWKVATTKSGPLHLLDLPVEVLRLVTKEITHTNDLTALALTCTTLYNLAVPHIYARFDIVWPDSTIPSAESKSVDALTYGLATLCLGSKFSQRSRWLRRRTPGESTNNAHRLIDNQYAKYTRKFSLGNGPADWVAEYNITKESGKMLGTLVALAVNKMVNLETFVWDMPTGVLSDVFMALASLQDHYADGQPRLNKVWIRWHDNQEVAGTVSSMSSPAAQPAMSMVIPTAGAFDHIHTSSTITSAMRPPPRYSESHVEYPTFSILPPLKSLTVLDIDELAYVDEMSTLIERSMDTLHELRVGVSQKASTQDWANTWEGGTLQQVDFNARWPGESNIGDKRLGGVLGVLVGRIFQIRRKGTPAPKQRNASSTAAHPNPFTTGVITPDGSPTWIQLAGAAQAAAIGHGMAHDRPEYPSPYNQTTLGTEQDGQTNRGSYHGRRRLEGKLKLRTLELERIPLAMQVCCKAFDWSVLTNLTILNCGQHEMLWKLLKRQFQPTPPHDSLPGTPTHYHVNLKKIHTDRTTPALVSFIKETLTPNTLEVLFLQDRCRTTAPAVTIEQIFKGAIKRHHASLTKLLLDSTERLGREGNRWRHWVVTSDMIAYITSGRMPSLKEMAISIHYRDWHHFLQRLPSLHQLRSLHMQHVQEHIQGAFEPKELALQLVDIITLRPEIQLCYVGIANKCFEILEAPVVGGPGGADHMGPSSHHHHHHHHHQAGAVSITDVDEEDEEGDDDHSEADETEDEEEGEGEGEDADSNPDAATDEDEDGFHEGSDDGESDAGSSFLEFENSHSVLRLREILFYDDKVAIFKARHARL